MQTETIATVLARMERDIASLRKLMVNGTKPAPSNAKVPVLKERYSKGAAILAKQEIDEAFTAGLISYDKKRGMKMMVTKATNGWTP